MGFDVWKAQYRVCTTRLPAIDSSTNQRKPEDCRSVVRKSDGIASALTRLANDDLIKHEAA
jgi:hypothetical protein